MATGNRLDVWKLVCSCTEQCSESSSCSHPTKLVFYLLLSCSFLYTTNLEEIELNDCCQKGKWDWSSVHEQLKKKSWHRNLTFPNHRQSCRCSPLWGMSASSECCHANLFTTITTLIPGYRVCLSLCTRVQAECITLTARRCVCFSVESGPRVLLVPPQPPVIDCSRGTARINQWVRTKLPT